MPAKVLLPRIPKPKLLRSNPLRKSLIRAGYDPAEVVDDEDLITLQRRRHNFENLDNDVSDYVSLRLAIARIKALEKYRENWG